MGAPVRGSGSIPALAVLVEDGLQKLRGLDLAGRIRRADAQVLAHQVNGHILVDWPIDLVVGRLGASRT